MRSKKTRHNKTVKKKSLAKTRSRQNMSEVPNDININDLDTDDINSIKKDEEGNIVLTIHQRVEAPAPPVPVQPTIHEVIENNRKLNIEEGKYTNLRHEVLRLMKEYQEKYPECVLIPSKLIPQESMHINELTQECKKNFFRGWSMGTNWAQLFYTNNYDKLNGWTKLQSTGDFFKTNSKENNDEFECAFMGLKRGYYHNFELLEGEYPLYKLKSYDDMINLKYHSLSLYYNELKSFMEKKPNTIQHPLTLLD